MNIARRFTPQVIRFRADVEGRFSLLFSLANVETAGFTGSVSCFEYEGINAIKRALLAGKAAVTRDGEEVVSVSWLY